MSSSPENNAAGIAAQARDVLRGQSNPFEALVRPQRVDDRFAELHVAALLREPRELLLRVIDSYRLDEYRAAADLHDTRVVIVTGARGTGKTHTLEAILHREDGRPQLIVSPRFFEPGMPFEEFVLAALWKALLDEDPVHGGRPFLDVAAQLTRRLLRQAVRQLGPTDRLFSCPQTRLQRFRLLWGGGEARADRFDRLALELEDGASDLHAARLRHGFPPAFLMHLADAHIRQSEPGDDLLPAIRRQLYAAMARATLLGDQSLLGQLLEAEYTPAGSRPFFRGDVVQHMLHALVEACTLVKMPLVMAFDNLESIVAPQGAIQPEAGRAFLNGLAQAVDSTRGILFLLLAEKQLYQQLESQHADAFVKDRIYQGVPLAGHGPVDRIELQGPKPAELRGLVDERVRRLLPGLPYVADLPAGFPFEGAFLNDLSQRQDLTLRGCLLRLRDEYSRLVYGRDLLPPITPRLPPDWANVFEQVWKHALKDAARDLQAGLLSQRQALHVGLGRLLQHAGPLEADGWALHDVRPAVSIGNHPAYGVVTLTEWQRTTGDNGARVIRRIGIGLLLAGGPGMAKDLQAKFALFDDPATPADGLVVLWPKPAEGEPALALPGATRDVWDKARHRKESVVRAISDDDLRQILAFPAWVDGIQATGEKPAAASVETFVRGRCAAVLAKASPPQGVSSHAH